MPEVGVLMSVYNTRAFVMEAVESIVAQSFRDFEFVIINDGSTDGCGELLNGITDKRVRVVHRQNRGVGASLNEALSLCEAEFVARMDSDDVSLPRRLELELAFLRARPEVGLVGTQIAYMTSDGRPGLSPPLSCRHEDICSDLLRGRHAVTHGSVMMRASLVKQVGGYRIRGSGQDLDLFLRLSEVSRLANLEDVGLLVRLRTGSVTAESQAVLQGCYAYAVHCAQRRRAGLSEASLDEFFVAWRRRHWWCRVVGRLDDYSLRQYRHAIDSAARQRGLRGYARLAVAAVCSPARTYQRVSRWLRHRGAH